MCALGMSHSESFARGRMSSVASTSACRRAFRFYPKSFKTRLTIFLLFIKIHASFTSSEENVKSIYFFVELVNPFRIDLTKSSSCKMHPLSFLLGNQSWIKSNVSMQFCTLMRVLHASLRFVCAERFTKGMLLCKHRWCSWQKHDYCWKRVHVGTLTESPGSRVTLYIGCIKAAGPSAVWPVDSCTANMLSNRWFKISNWTKKINS